MTNLKDILKTLRLKRSRLEKDVAELIKRQNFIVDKISWLEADKLRVASRLNAQSHLDFSITDNVVFELWCQGLVQKKQTLTHQKLDIDTSVEVMKAKLKAIFVQEDVILSRLVHQDYMGEVRRIETESTSHLELWVNMQKLTGE